MTSGGVTDFQAENIFGILSRVIKVRGRTEEWEVRTRGGGLAAIFAAAAAVLSAGCMTSIDTNVHEDARFRAVEYRIVGDNDLFLAHGAVHLRQ